LLVRCFFFARKSTEKRKVIIVYKINCVFPSPINICFTAAFTSTTYNSQKIDKKKTSVAGSSASGKTVTSTTTCTVQNVLLILLHASINEENNEDSQNIIMQLQHVVNSVNLFEDVDECVTFLREKKDEKVIMIILDSLAQLIVPLVHDISQLDSVFIFCTTTKCHEQWAKDWSKIKGMYTEIASICKAFKVIVHQCEENTIPISFIATSG
jgi:hypothetical protein